MTQPSFTMRYPMRPPDYVVVCRGPRAWDSWVTNLCQVCALGNDERCRNVVNPTLSHHCRKKKAQRVEEENISESLVKHLQAIAIMWVDFSWTHSHRRPVTFT